MSKARNAQRPKSRYVGESQGFTRLISAILDSFRVSNGANVRGTVCPDGANGATTLAMKAKSNRHVLPPVRFRFPKSVFLRVRRSPTFMLCLIPLPEQPRPSFHRQLPTSAGQTMSKRSCFAGTRPPRNIIRKSKWQSTYPLSLYLVLQWPLTDTLIQGETNTSSRGNVIATRRELQEPFLHFPSTQRIGDTSMKAWLPPWTPNPNRPRPPGPWARLDRGAASTARHYLPL